MAGLASTGKTSYGSNLKPPRRRLNPAKVGGVAVPLGTFTNTSGNARTNQVGRAYYANGREYHVYNGKTVSFKRAADTPEQQAALTQRFQTAVKPRQQVVDLVNRSYGPNLARSEGTPVPDLKKAAETVRRDRIKNFSAKGRKPSRRFPRK